MSFDISTLPSVNIIESSYGSAEIKSRPNSYILLNNGQRWMVQQKNGYRSFKELYSSYDLAYGNVLISGLGFGMLALWLANKPGVNTVTVVEISSDIIELFKMSNTVPENMIIINDDMTTFSTEIKYDCLLLDHYETQDVNWIIKDAMNIANRISHDVFWFWPLEQIYIQDQYKIGLTEKSNASLDYSYNWKRFLKDFFPNENKLFSLSKNTINLYIYTYFNCNNNFDKYKDVVYN